MVIQNNVEPFYFIFLKYDMVFIGLITDCKHVNENIWEGYRTLKGLYGSHQGAVMMKVR